MAENSNTINLADQELVAAAAMLEQSVFTLQHAQIATVLYQKLLPRLQEIQVQRQAASMTAQQPAPSPEPKLAKPK